MLVYGNEVLSLHLSRFCDLVINQLHAVYAARMWACVCLHLGHVSYVSGVSYVEFLQEAEPDVGRMSFSY